MRLGAKNTLRSGDAAVVEAAELASGAAVEVALPSSPAVSPGDRAVSRCWRHSGPALSSALRWKWRVRAKLPLLWVPGKDGLAGKYHPRRYRLGLRFSRLPHLHSEKSG